MKLFFKRAFVFILLSVISLSVCLADEGKKEGLQFVEFLTGYGLSKRHRHVDYRVIPLFIDFDFNIKPLMERKGINYWGLMQFVIEPFASYTFYSHQNAEVGGNFAVKIGFLPEGWVFQPYFKIGAGGIYLTQHFREQSTQLNFTEFAGAGLHYFLTKNTAFTIEYRHRHFSNADIKRPNTGIGTNFGLCGISYSF